VREEIRQRQQHRVTEIKHVSAPDAEERLRWAYDLILRAAARAEEEGAYKRNPTQDGEQEIDDGE